ncbi:MAG: DUF222 domain-containing protein, partial [Streptosporangiaceae bacterium]
MAAPSAPGPPGPDEDPARRPDEPGGDPSPDEQAGWWPGEMNEEDREAWLDGLAAEDEPLDLEEDPDPEEYFDPDGPPAPGEDELTAEEIAGIREVMDDQARAAATAARLGTTGALAAIAASSGRRGPGQPGSARRFPGESSSRAAAFGTGLVLDVMPGCPELTAFADQAAGDDDRYAGASDDELIGVLCAWDRLEAHMAARKLAAVAELLRRRPEPGCAVEGPARMPRSCDEFLGDELSQVLAESRGAVSGMVLLAHDLEVKLPGTRAAFRDGILRLGKAAIVAAATEVLDPEEARAAEALVLDRAGRLTPSGLRAAIARAVMEVAPDKAKKRREQAARNARVQRWAEDSGNAALMGRELPPAEVLAADQRIGWWARQLKKAGLEGSTDELRARAYLDLLLGKDSRPRLSARNGQDGTGPEDPGGGRPGPEESDGPAGPPDTVGPPASAVPAGFVGRVNLTIPLATLLDLAERPGEIPGIGPIDP